MSLPPDTSESPTQLGDAASGPAGGENMVRHILESSSNLVAQDGIWRSRNHTTVSYPEDGNSTCFEVEEESFWFRHRNELILELIERYAKAAVFFDVGGGNGYVAKSIQSAGCSVVLFEPGPAGARNAAARGVANVVQATIEDAGISAGVASAVGLFDVLEHIEQDIDFLRSMRRPLCDGGRLFLTVPAYSMLWSHDDVVAGHYRRYTKRSLVRCVEAAGYVPLFVSYMFWFLPPAIFTCRTLPSLFRSSAPHSIATTRREHACPGGLAGRVVSLVSNVERAVLAAGRAMPFGSSCVMVAQKR